MAESEQKPQVFAVVLNWNNASDTVSCLASLDHAGFPPNAILVVDNGSTDGSVDRLRSSFPKVEVLEFDKNTGFATGNNAGIRHVLQRGAEYVCVLNNDVNVEPNFMAPLLDCIRKSDNVAAATPLIVETSEPGRVWTLGCSVDKRTGMVSRRFASQVIAELERRKPFEVDVAPGTCMLISREAWHGIGQFDESYFLYYEETEWCLRALRAGYKIFAVPRAVVEHKVSSSLGKTSPIIDYYMLRNHLRLIGRHWSGLHRSRLLYTTVLRNLATIGTYTVKPNSGTRLPHRNARVNALFDAALGRSGEAMGDITKLLGRMAA